MKVEYESKETPRVRYGESEKHEFQAIEFRMSGLKDESKHVLHQLCDYRLCKSSSIMKSIKDIENQYCSDNHTLRAQW